MDRLGPEGPEVLGDPPPRGHPQDLERPVHPVDLESLADQEDQVDLSDLWDLSHPRDLAVLWGLILLLFLVVLLHHPRQ